MRVVRETVSVLVLAMIVSSAGWAQNHLRGQSSPYLRRASNQPVDWRPFGAKAFEEAAKLNRPMLLDVGAIWCPWCARMDRESYTVPETADYINQHFVAVKVDYDTADRLVAQLQRAQALLNLPAGLPLTSFITPDGGLYSGAGYLPAVRTLSSPSLRDAMREALELYAHPEKLQANSFRLDLKEIK